MDGSGPLETPARTVAYDGPPDYRAVGRHGVFPETSHDEIARLNVLAHLNRHLATKVMPHVKTAWDGRAGPAFEREHGRAPKDRHEVRKALLKDPAFATWSALRRLTMEQRQQAGRWTTIRQAEDLAAKVEALTAGDNRLSLDPHLQVPRYVSAVDHHCMPGSYHAELSSPATCPGRPTTTTAASRPRAACSGAIPTAAARPWSPGSPGTGPASRRSACSISAPPSARARCRSRRRYPQAEVVAIDVGAPMLRYALARAKTMGVDNISFVQANGADLSMFPDASFDWVQTTMFLHELSLPSLRAIFRESHRVLKPGGVVLHVEQPQYAADMPLFEQAMRDWDAFYNNEPFWSTLHEIDLDAEMVAAGFERDKLIHGNVTAVVDKAVFPDAADDDGEDYGRKAAWRLVGASR